MIWLIPALLVALALTVVLWLSHFTYPRRKGLADLGPIDEMRVETGHPKGARRAFLVRGRSARLDGPARPVVMAYHGGNGSGALLLRTSGLAAPLDQAGFAACLPDARRKWGDGRTETEAEWPEDKALFEALLARLAADPTLDIGHVFATGVSNGAMHAMRLAAEFGEVLSGVAAVLGAVPRPYLRTIPDGPPVPMLLINALEDRMMPYQGGIMPRLGGMADGGDVISVPDTVAFWAARNRCAPTPLTYQTVIGRQRAEVKEFRANPGTQGADLVAVTLLEGGHAWPPRGPNPMQSAENMITQFFSRQLQKSTQRQTAI